MRHGLTSRAVVLPSEDLAAYRRLTQEFFDEYQPQGPTEKQLVQELAAAAWRLNRIPALEADLLARATAPPAPESAIAFGTVGALRAIATSVVPFEATYYNATAMLTTGCRTCRTRDVSRQTCWTFRDVLDKLSKAGVF